MLRRRLERGTPDDLEEVGKHLRRLTMAQLVVLIVGAVASAGVALLLLLAVEDGRKVQNRTAAGQEALVDTRLDLHQLALDIALQRLYREPGALPAEFLLRFMSLDARIRRVANNEVGDAQTLVPGVDCEGCPAAAARARSLGSLDRVRALIGELPTSSDPLRTEARMVEESDRVALALDDWIAAGADEVRAIRASTSERTRRLGVLAVFVIGAVSVGGLLLWVLLDGARARTMRRLARDEARLQALARNSSDLVLIVDADGVIRYASSSVGPRLGRGVEEVIGRRLTSLVHPDDVGRLGVLQGDGHRGGAEGAVEWRLRSADDRWVWIEALITDARHDPSVSGWVVNTRDISDRKAAEDQLTRQAFEDSLTGLPNRALFGDRLRQALAGGARTGEAVAVALVDLDDFKTVNDSLGHAAGDRVLQELGRRIASVIRAQDTASRLGGDEFAILYRGVGAREARMMSERIVEELSRPIVVEQSTISMQSSIGVALGGANARDEEALLRNADVAMYAAKTQAGGAVELFRPEMQAAAHERLELKQELSEAARAGQLSLHFQPIFELDGERLAGFEGLLRWTHPERGTISPETFIPLAEETGLIHELGRWVLERACHEAARWTDEAGFRGYVAVNVSGAQLDDPDLSDVIAGAIWAAGLDPGSLVVEVTESALPTDPGQALEVLQRLRDLGIGLAIDDFGTGYSSLSYLGSLPVDIIKMDKCFVDGLDEAGRESDLAATILRIGSGLGLVTVAEGIEAEVQAERLRLLGCELGQGFLFSRAVEADAAAALVAAQPHDPAPQTDSFRPAWDARTAPS